MPPHDHDCDESLDDDEAVNSPMPRIAASFPNTRLTEEWTQTQNMCLFSLLTRDDGKEEPLISSVIPTTRETGAAMTSGRKCDVTHCNRRRDPLLTRRSFCTTSHSATSCPSVPVMIHGSDGAQHLDQDPYSGRRGKKEEEEMSGAVTGSGRYSHTHTHTHLMMTMLYFSRHNNNT